MASDPGFVLKCTDEAVAILQSVVTILGSYYEKTMKNTNRRTHRSLYGPNMDAVRLNLLTVSELLAELWPCENKYVAVIGPTGAGKTTLLNTITAMTCKTGESYLEGIKQGACRAALRETARHQGEDPTFPGSNSVEDDEDADNKEVASGSQADSPLTLAGLEGGRAHQEPNLVVQADIHAERRSIGGLLGMCCARTREAYISKNLAAIDKNPFLLLSGRMGDAGTSKVTSVQWGPKFSCRVRWIDKKKLRKRFRELRKVMVDPKSGNEGAIDEARAKGNKELWERTLSICGHYVQSDRVPLPTEELIDSMLDSLAKQVPLGKSENIETTATQGCLLDRLHVREGVRKRLFEQKLGLLCDELIIEAPIPSSEGGVSLLDVPGTNDPRILHQLETRDAIDRTALILLILDKSVLDEATVTVLEDSPILERMLLDAALTCSLIVVGVAEKGANHQTPGDTIANFDPNNDLEGALRKILFKKAKNLTVSRRLDKEVALQRVRNIFDGGRFSVLPVLPLLCASLHISTFNHKLHTEYCESNNQLTCPLVMGEEELRKKCLETNIPQLLQKIHSVRLPPTIHYLRSQVERAKELLETLIQKSTYDLTMVDFLKRELENASCARSFSIRVETFLPERAVDSDWITEVLSTSAEDCQMSTRDIQFVTLKLGTRAAIKALDKTELSNLAPIIMRGFRPEVIGELAHKIIAPTEKHISDFVGCIHKEMEKLLNGGPGWRDTTMEEVGPESIGSCVALLDEVQKRWKHNLDRIVAGCLCGGEKGGLLKVLKDTLRKTYESTFKDALKELQKNSNGEVFKAALSQFLVLNKAGKKVQQVAGAEIDKYIQEFWTEAYLQVYEDLPKMWQNWEQQLQRLKRSVQQALQSGNTSVKVDGQVDRALQNSLQERIHDLDCLLRGLDAHLISKEPVDYGYSLLQSNPCFEPDLEIKRNRSYFIRGLKIDTATGEHQDCSGHQGEEERCTQTRGQSQGQTNAAAEEGLCGASTAEGQMKKTEVRLDFGSSRHVGQSSLSRSPPAHHSNPSPHLGGTSGSQTHRIEPYPVPRSPKPSNWQHPNHPHLMSVPNRQEPSNQPTRSLGRMTGPQSGRQVVPLSDVESQNLQLRVLSPKPPSVNSTKRKRP